MEVRVYALTGEQGLVNAEIAAVADIVYVHESELPEPEARVSMKRNVAAPAAQPC